MKRKWAKKVKAGKSGTVRGQAHASVALIGLIISAGASNLILTKPSDSAPAAEPAVAESTASKILAGQANSRANQPNSIMELLLSEDIFFSTLLTSNPLVDLKAETVVAPAELAFIPEEQVRQAQQSLTRQNQTSESRDAIVFDRNLSKQKLLQALRTDRLVRQLKHGQTVATISQPGADSRSYVRSLAIAASSELRTAEARSLAMSEANNTWTTQQKLLIDRLKQKSNRLQVSRAQLRFEESNSRAGAASVIGEERPLTTRNKLLQQLRNQQLQSDLVASRAAGTSIETPKQGRSTNIDLTQSSSTKAVVLNLPKLAVDRPTVVVPSALVPATALEYQVKAGDTLWAIAHQHGISLWTLVKANHLNDPNRLQIAQRIAIPISQSNSTIAQNTGWLKLPKQVPADSQIDSDSVSTEASIAPSLNAAYSGMGGEISDNDTVEATPPNIEAIQQAQSAAAKEELLSNLYVQNLRTDIQKLRQKYNTEGVLTGQAVPSANQMTAPAIAADSTQKLLAQQLRPNSSGAKNLQLDRQKQNPSLVRTRDGVATVPLGADAADSLQSYQERNVSPALPPLDGVDTYLPKPALVSAKGYIWPAKGKLSSGYGWRWGRMHKGIDIAAPVGTPIFASAAGVVVKAGWNSGGYGNLVDIQHSDGSVTRYAHNKRLLVRAGEVVQQGQQISEMGSTGFSTGPHLHFEVRPLGKKAVNPIAFLPR